MRVCIFGSGGMLGRYVSKHLKNYDTIEVTRKDLDVSECDLTKISNYIDLHGGLYTNDVIINCIGLIKQKMSPGDDVKAIRVNSVFPRLLQDYSIQKKINFIHISTDCVFSGKKGDYLETDIPDPEDMYGITKLAGEPEGCMVIRTSVIGEGDFKGSLLEWVKSQKEINGYTNHFWNGVTCHQLAKEIGKIIKGEKWYGMRHYFSSPVTKAELVRDIAKVYGLDIKITDVEAPTKIDRTLNTVFKDTFDYPPDIRTQLKEQRESL